MARPFPAVRERIYLRIAQNEIFDRDRVAQLRAQGFSIRQIAAKVGIGVGTAARTLQGVSKVQSGEVEQ